MPLGTPRFDSYTQTISVLTWTLVSLSPLAAALEWPRGGPAACLMRPVPRCQTNDFPTNRLPSAFLRRYMPPRSHKHYLLGAVCDVNASPPEQGKPGTLYDPLGPLSPTLLHWCRIGTSPCDQGCQHVNYDRTNNTCT